MAPDAGVCAVWAIAAHAQGCTNLVTIQPGCRETVNMPADFDGDGKTDVAVDRASTGTWSLLMSSTSFTTSASVQWELAGDLPILTRP
jgi:hypothetical protein